MGELDNVALQFMRNPRNFADVFNFKLYQGKQVINPDDLKAVDPVLLTVKPDKNVKKSDCIKKERDILKECAIFKDDQFTYLYLGVENQEYIDWLMPFRIMLYDAVIYKEQIDNEREAQKNTKKRDSAEFLMGVSKTTRFKPVITVVCNFSSEPWSGPTHIHELLDVKSMELLSYIPDYHFLLFDPYSLSDEQVNSLHSQLKPVAQCLRASHNKEALNGLFQSEAAFKSLEMPTVQLINALLHLKLDFNFKHKENVNMCQAWNEIQNDLRNEGRIEGRNEGRIEGRNEGRIEGRNEGRIEGRNEEREQVIFNMLSKGRYSDDDILDIFHISVEKLNEYKLNYQKHHNLAVSC